MKASLLIALVTVATISAAFAQFPGPDPYGDFPPIDSDSDPSVPPAPPSGNLTPFVQLDILEQENGCHLLAGYAFDPEGTSMVYEWMAVNQDTGAETLLGTQLSLMVCLPSGTYIVSFKATDQGGAAKFDTTSLVVEARRNAPDLKLKSVTPSVLWPPNGKLWPVQLAYEVTHDSQSTPEVRIASVTCNQQLGQNDIKQGGPLELYLAARRTSRLGERIYEVTIEAVDEHGLSDQETITIRVPADSESTLTAYTARKTRSVRR